MAIVKWASKGSFAQVTPRLTIICFFLSFGSVVFGYDTGVFGGMNAIPGFINRFGECHSGQCAIPTAQLSLMSSIAFVGKFFGCWIAGPLIERVNHRNAMYIMCAICIIGTVIEATAKVWQQFMVGRIVIYFAVGITEVTVPTFEAELVPAPARGAFVSSIQFFNGCGGLTATIVNRVLSSNTHNTGWLVPTCIQALWPALITCGLWVIPLSPRWLITKGRFDDAVEVLKSIRPEAYAASGACTEEAYTTRMALEEYHNLDKGSWLELFKGTDLRRTTIACVVFAFAQFTGQAFMNGYGPRFYTAVGLHKYAFDYQLVGVIVGVVASLIAMVIMDHVGRRAILIWGAAAQACFLMIAAGLGILRDHSTHVNPNTSHFFVSCIILYTAFYLGSWGATPYLLAAEIGTGRLREKTMALSAAVNVLGAFIVSFSSPYLIQALSSNVGWIFGGLALLACLFAYFWVPETKNMPLEELDARFAAGIPASKFSQWHHPVRGEQQVVEASMAMEGAEEKLEIVHNARSEC